MDYIIVAMLAVIVGAGMTAAYAKGHIDQLNRHMGEYTRLLNGQAR